MDVKHALKGQYHAGLKMLRQCIKRCPDDVWLSGDHPRNFWRIAFHAVYYTRLYLLPSWEDYKPWKEEREECRILWQNPAVEPAYTKAELTKYLNKVDKMVDELVDALDLESPETGFYWYKNMTKLEHQLLNVRHLAGHYGQLSEILMQHGIEIDWVSSG